MAEDAVQLDQRKKYNHVRSLERIKARSDSHEPDDAVKKDLQSPLSIPQLRYC